MKFLLLKLTIRVHNWIDVEVKGISQPLGFASGLSNQFICNVGNSSRGNPSNEKKTPYFGLLLKLHVTTQVFGLDILWYLPFSGMNSSIKPNCRFVRSAWSCGNPHDFKRATFGTVSGLVHSDHIRVLFCEIVHPRVDLKVSYL